MQDFFKWLRDRFTMAGLLNFSNVDDNTLSELLFQNQVSRDEFIKNLVYKLLLDINSESEDSEQHNLEEIFVSFGLLDKETAQQFLKGTMSTDLHIVTWKKIIEALVPTTVLVTNQQYIDYENMLSTILAKYSFLQTVKNKNYLPPELIPKLKAKASFDKNDKESSEESLEDLLKIVKKLITQDECKDNKTISTCEEQSSIDMNLENMDLAAIKEEIDQYIKISYDNPIVTPISDQSSKIISPQKLVDSAKKQNWNRCDHFQSKVNNINELMKAEQSLRILVSSLASLK